MYTRHTWVFGRDARLSHPIAALRLLAIGLAITRRRALLSGTRDAPRFPENPCTKGISPEVMTGKDRLFVFCALLDRAGDVPLLCDGEEVVHSPIEHQTRGKEGEKDGEDVEGSG